MKKTLKIIGVIVGIVAAICVAGIQTNYHSTEISKKDASQEQPVRSDVFIVALQDSFLPSSVQVNPDQALAFVFNIFQSDLTTENVAGHEMPVSFNKFSLVLFRIIISPNAP